MRNFSFAAYWILWIKPKLHDIVSWLDKLRWTCGARKMVEMTTWYYQAIRWYEKCFASLKWEFFCVFFSKRENICDTWNASGFLLVPDIQECVFRQKLCDNFFHSPHFYWICGALDVEKNTTKNVKPNNGNEDLLQIH